jgi:hypothetical protein
MHGNAAFTLLELLVYTALFSFFTLLVAGFCQFVFMTMHQQGGVAERTLKNAVVLDMLFKDVMSASMNVQAWDAERGVFKKELLDDNGKQVTVCVGYEVSVIKDTQKSVRRRAGDYDFDKRIWKKCISSQIGCALSSLHVQLVLSNDQRSVVRAIVDYDDEAESMQHKKMVVALRNRVLV